MSAVYSQPAHDRYTKDGNGSISCIFVYVLIHVVCGEECSVMLLLGLIIEGYILWLLLQVCVSVCVPVCVSVYAFVCVCVSVRERKIEPQCEDMHVCVCISVCVWVWESVFVCVCLCVLHIISTSTRTTPSLSAPPCNTSVVAGNLLHWKLRGTKLNYHRMAEQ